MKTTILQWWRSSILLIFTFSIVFASKAQDCTSKYTVQLTNIKGGFFGNQTVILKSIKDGKEYKKVSNAKGEVEFELPCDQKFEINISNYTRKEEVSSPKGNASSARENFTYSADMKQKEAVFAMSATEKAEVDKRIALLPDTTKISTTTKPLPKDIEMFTTFTLKLKDLESKPLTEEVVIFTGINRNKSFKGKTNTEGVLIAYLPKGDVYSINFLYNSDFRKEEVEYKKGTSTTDLSIMYMGTKEYLRRKKIEEERIKAEEARIKKEHDDFVKWCKALKISEEEGHKRKLLGESTTLPDTVVLAALRRNKWSEKLIVCDLTGSMNPYSNQLSAWYQLNYKKETNLQFVFFNDGDNKADNQKKIGETGGIYYQKSKGLDSLIAIMSKVRSNGYGGDGPENNMEALIKGVKMANPYKELVMIADNYAPIKDIQLLKNFNRPVHIILCGAQNSEVLADYLLVAWKTKGSVHTIEEDIYKIAGMLEGESITIQGLQYQIMGGQFVRITKL